MNYEGNAGFIFHKKLKEVQEKIREWVKINLLKVVEKIGKLELLLNGLELEEEEQQLTQVERDVKHKTNIELLEALNQEDMLWKKEAKGLWQS